MNTTEESIHRCRLVTASVDEKIACDAFSICRFRERVPEDTPFTRACSPQRGPEAARFETPRPPPGRRAYLAADPQLGSFKRMLSLAGRENEPRRDNFHSVDPSPSRSLVSLVLIHALKALPKAQLPPHPPTPPPAASTLRLCTPRLAVCAAQAALAPLHDELVRVGGDKRRARPWSSRPSLHLSAGPHPRGPLL